MDEQRISKIAGNLTGSSSKTAGQVPNFDTAKQYVDFIKRTLVPDLKRSGTEYTAEDLENLVNQIKKGRRDNSHVRFLENTLIPDLRESGTNGVADDFEEGIYWLDMIIDEKISWKVATI